MTTAIPIGPSFAENQLCDRDTPSSEAPQLTETVRYDAAPWVYMALMGIHDKERTGMQIPGIGDFRVEPFTANAARQAVACVTLAELPAPAVTHMSGGGLSLIWTIRERRIEIDVFPHGDVTLSAFSDDNLLRSYEMLEVREERPVLLIRSGAVKDQFHWLLRSR